MSDTTSQTAGESEKISPAMLEILKDIGKLNSEPPTKQRKILIEKKDILTIDRIGLLDESEKIKTQIIFCRAIKPGVFTAYANARDIYQGATKTYGDFSNNLAENFSYYKYNISVLPRHENFFNFANKGEKELLGDTLDRLLNGVHINLQSGKGSGVDLEARIENASRILLFVINAANVRAKEAEGFRGLEDEASFFEGKASKYKISARLFLFAAFIFLALIIFLPSFLSHVLPSVFPKDSEMLDELSKLADKKNVSKSFYFYLALKMILSSRMTMFIIFVAGFFSCIRFYAAHSHNVIICDQRTNTLKSFRSLYAASEVDDKRLVLEKVLDSATAHQPTGFSKQQSDHGGSSEFSLLSKILPFLKRD